MAIRFEKFRLNTQTTDSLRFVLTDQNIDRPYALVYFSENSTFIEDYPKLNLRPVDFRIVLVPWSILPKSSLTKDMRDEYKKLGLLAYSSRLKNMPKRRNIIIDISEYIAAIDKYLKPINYRLRAGRYIISLLKSVAFNWSKDYELVFVYSIDINKPIFKIIDRRVFPIVRNVRDEEFPFKHFILSTIGASSVRYRLLMKNGSFNYAFLWQYIKAITQSHRPEIEDHETVDIPKVDKDDDPEIESASQDIVKHVEPHVDKKNVQKFKSSISSFLKKDNKSLDRVISKEVTPEEKQKIAIASILYKSTGDLQRAKSIAKYIPTKDVLKALVNVDKKYADELLPRVPTLSTSEHPIVKLVDIPEIVEKKVPTHIISKRQIDFHENLKKDVISSFSTLAKKKEGAVRLEKLEIEDKPEKRGEVEKTDLATLKVVLKDEFGNVHKIVIDIPKIDQFGTFRVNGIRQCLLNQIIFCPITFPKRYDSRFESFYSQFHIKSKRVREPYYLEIYMGGNIIPLLICLGYGFGFDNVLKDYGISYKVVDKKSKEEFSSKVNEDKYIIFEKVDNELKQELCTSFIKAKVWKYKIDKEFPSREYFNDLIIKLTGRINSTYMIQTNIENIIDPVTKQVLLNKGQPVTLDQVMRYMASKVVTGYIEDLNDLSSRRIRSSEVLVHLLQEQIEAAYTVYRSQILSGNKSAKLEISPIALMKKFKQQEIVVNMEYSNPLEELATLTKISPIGKSISGIPGRESVQVSARDINDSFFGNIDPLDTPEGEMVGIVQYLTVDANITTSRGLFFKKSLDDKEKSGILSTSSSMIPFIERNDGARVLMADGHSKQALPLKNPESPIVQSGYESVLTRSLSDNFLKPSPCDGVVQNITNDSITIECKDGEKESVDITPRYLRSGTGKDTLSVFNVKVEKNQKVRKNQILAEGACISNGMISLGRTLCVAIMNYKGYNFEDGIVVSEKLISEEKLTSLHGEEIDVWVSEKDRILFVNSIGTVTERGDALLRKTRGEIEELLGYTEEVEDESVYISGREFMKKSPGGVIVDIEVFTNVKSERFPLLKDLIERTSRKYRKPSADPFTIKGERINGVLVRFRVEQELKITLGDKICNRYGNKGIISLIEKSEYMPRTPWGEEVDIILNPLGLVSRMNIGQLFEIYCGLISKALAIKIVESNDQNRAVEGLRRTLPLLDGTTKKIYSSSLIQSISRLTKADFSRLIDSITKTKFFPIIIPPFQSPKLQDIKKCLKALGLDDGYHLTLPEFATKTSEKVPVGYMYIYKLEHLGELKIYGRSTGIVSGKVMQPVSGRRLEGGQKIGENDTYSLFSYNCPILLSELFGPLSDDHTTKNEIISDIIHTGGAKYREAKVSPVKDLLNAYLVSLMLAPK